MKCIFLHITVKIIAFQGVVLPGCCTKIHIMSCQSSICMGCWQLFYISIQ